MHLCVDMQRLFSAEGPWPTPWMSRVLPVVSELAGHHPERTIFTRFIPPKRPTDMPGMWQRYYSRWKEATRERLDPALLELSPPLAKLCPPAEVLDKTLYSAFSNPHLFELLRAKEADGLIITGSETDVCVLAISVSKGSAVVNRGTPCCLWARSERRHQPRGPDDLDRRSPPNCWSS